MLISNGSSESAMSDRRGSQEEHSISFGLAAAGDGASAPSWLDCLLAEDDCAASGPADQVVQQQPGASLRTTLRDELRTPHAGLRAQAGLLKEPSAPVSGTLKCASWMAALSLAISAAMSCG